MEISLFKPVARLDGLYIARRRKVHGFCQPDRPATEQEARGSPPGERTGVHHTASVFGVIEEEGMIRAAVLMGLLPGESDVRRIRGELK